MRVQVRSVFAGLAIAVVGLAGSAGAVTTGVHSLDPGEELAVPQVELTSWSTPADEWENRVSPYAVKLIEVAEESGRFTREYLDFDTHSLLLMGTGDVPPAVEELAGDAPSDLAIQWKSVPFTAEELENAADAVIASGTASGVSWGGDSPLDFDSVTALVDSAADLTRARAGSAKARTSGVPVRFEISAAKGSSGTRANEDAPFWGGSRIKPAGSSSSGTCSTAFPIEFANGIPGIYTASHCTDQSVGASWQTALSAESPASARTTVGVTTVTQDPNEDFAGIKGETYGRTIFTGTPNGTGHRSLTGVVDRILAGTTLCSSGGFSGNSCNLYVTGESWEGSYTNHPFTMKLLVVESDDGDAIFGDGDSGGAVYKSAGTGAYAAAMVSGAPQASQYRATCKGIQLSGDRACYTRGYIATVNRAMASLDFTIRTQ